MILDKHQKQLVEVCPRISADLSKSLRGVAFSKRESATKTGGQMWWHLVECGGVFADRGGRRHRRVQGKTLLETIMEGIVSLPLTLKHARGVRRIVYATRCAAAHLKDGRRIEGNALGGRSVYTEGWRTVARMARV